MNPSRIEIVYSFFVWEKSIEKNISWNFRLFEKEKFRFKYFNGLFSEKTLVINNNSLFAINIEWNYNEGREEKNPHHHDNFVTELF